MKNKILLVIGIATCTWLMRCEDIIEEDITNDEVVLIAPGDGVEADSASVTFFWEELQDADEYSFQVVTGNFETPDLLIFDTLLTTNKFELSLDSGTYQWGVSAINSQYATAYSVRTLIVNRSNQASGTITLQFPNDGAILTDTVIQFNWQSNAAVDQYFFQVQDEEELWEVTTNPFVLKSFESIDANYQWKVVGIIEDQNATIESPTYSFSIDVE